MITINILSKLNIILSSPFKDNITLYHGCPSTEAFENIQKNGLMPRITKKTKGRNSKLMPMIDSIYLSKKLPYAMMYAFHANMAGYRLNQQEIEDIYNGVKSRHGYIFTIDSNTLADDVKPDEDTVGLLFYYKVNNEDFYCEDSNLTIKNHDIPNFIINIASRYVNKTTYDRAVTLTDFGDVARIGKIILRYMTDEQKIYLATIVDNISTIGPLYPKHCYRIDKFDRHEYKKDGSNFFELAEKLY